MLASCVPNLLLEPVAVGPFKKQKITAYNLISGVDCRRDSWVSVSAGIYFQQRGFRGLRTVFCG